MFAADQHITDTLTMDDVKHMSLASSLEVLVCSSGGLGLTLATPLQRAICRVASGAPLGELENHPHVREAIGRTDLLWNEPPQEVYLLGPSRTGKSTIIAGLALLATQTVDVSHAMAVAVRGERPRYTIISIEKDKAEVIFNVIANALRGPLSSWASQEPSDSTQRAYVMHPAGIEVEIVVAAGKAGGSAVISRWCLGLALDEATRMHGDERQVSITQTRTAALDRLLGGAQIVYLGSKWNTDGHVYETAKTFGGVPDKTKSIVVVGWDGAEGHKLNPLYYTEKKYMEIKNKDNGDSAYLVATNKWQSPPRNIFSLDYLYRLARPAPKCSCDSKQRAGLPSEFGAACPHGDSQPNPRQFYLPIIDPATKRNAWSLVILTVREIRSSSPSDMLEVCPACARFGEKFGNGGVCAMCRGTRKVGKILGYRDDVALVRQWQGTSVVPLDPDKIFEEIAGLLRPYRCSTCYTDEWSSDANKALALHHGIYLSVILNSEGKHFRMKDKVAGYDGIASALAMNDKCHYGKRSIELHPCPALLGDLSRIVRRATQSGVVIDTPTSSDGRHCDLAEALARGYTQVLQRPDEVEVFNDPSLAAEMEERDRMSMGDDGSGWSDTVYDELIYDDE
jgi:hypothetical protein